MIGFRKSQAIVVGINAYRHGIPPLRTAVNDARRIAHVLEGDYGYEVHLLDNEVTLTRLRVLFDEVSEEIGEDDRLLVYFAGHGVALDGEDGPAGFLIPEDARRDDSASFLPMTELAGWLERLHCRHLLLILDCCFAGAFRWSSVRDLGPLPEVIHQERFDRYVRDRAWQVITSAAHDQKALEVLSGETIGVRDPGAARHDHSPFAAALFRALEGEADLVPRPADGRPGGDGVITATELYLYLRECVEAGVEAAHHRQTPGFWPLKKHDKGEFIHLVPGHPLNLPPAPPLDASKNPWRGLQSYEEQHASLFFGRSKLIADLAEQVRARPLTIVAGASGTGKSSVVKAGLIPELRADPKASWTILPPIRPGRSPLASLASLEIPGDGSGTWAAEPWLDAEALASRLKDWAEAEPSGGYILLMIDQLEELVSECWDGWEAQRFLELVARASHRVPERFRVVATVRADFEAQFQEGPLGGQWIESRFVIPPMSQDELREVIEGPASERVLYFEPRDLADRLINDVVQTPGALPLLSFALSEMYLRYLERRSDDRALVTEDYEAVGGVAGALRNRAEAVYEALDRAEQETMRQVLLRMISAEGGELARRRVLRQELVFPSKGENARVGLVVERLVRARLVVGGDEPGGGPYLEPAHDELIRGWSRLLHWSRDHKEEVQLRRLLTPVALDWDRGQGGTWHANPRLNLVKDARWLNLVESRFVERSVSKRRKIRRTVVGSMAVTIVVLSCLTLFALNRSAVATRNFRRAEETLSRSLLRPMSVETQQPISYTELEALWDLASLSEEFHRVRELFFMDALANANTARQMRTRYELIAHSAVGLDLDLRRRVVSDILVPTLDARANSDEPGDREIRMACADAGIALDADRMPGGERFAQLAAGAIIDAIPFTSDFQMQERQLRELDRLLGKLDRPYVEELIAEILAYDPDLPRPGDSFYGAALAVLTSEAGAAANERVARLCLDAILAPPGSARPRYFLTHTVYHSTASRVDERAAREFATRLLGESKRASGPDRSAMLSALILPLAPTLVRAGSDLAAPVRDHLLGDLSPAYTNALSYTRNAAHTPQPIEILRDAAKGHEAAFLEAALKNLGPISQNLVESGAGFGNASNYERQFDVEVGRLADVLAELASALDRSTAHALAPRVATALSDGDPVAARLVPLIAIRREISPELGPEEAGELTALAARRIIESIGRDGPRASPRLLQFLASLAPHLPAADAPDLVSRAVASLRTTTDPGAITALVDLVDRLAGTHGTIDRDALATEVADSLLSRDPTLLVRYIAFDSGVMAAAYGRPDLEIQRIELGPLIARPFGQASAGARSRFLASIAADVEATGDPARLALLALGSSTLIERYEGPPAAGLEQSVRSACLRLVRGGRQPQDLALIAQVYGTLPKSAGPSPVRAEASEILDALMECFPAEATLAIHGPTLGLIAQSLASLSDELGPEAFARGSARVARNVETYMESKQPDNIAFWLEVVGRVEAFRWVAHALPESRLRTVARSCARRLLSELPRAESAGILVDAFRTVASHLDEEERDRYLSQILMADTKMLGAWESLGEHLSPPLDNIRMFVAQYARSVQLDPETLLSILRLPVCTPPCRKTILDKLVEVMSPDRRIDDRWEFASWLKERRPDSYSLVAGPAGISGSEAIVGSGSL